MYTVLDIIIDDELYKFYIVVIHCHLVTVISQQIVCMYVCRYVRMYVCTYECMYVYMCIFVYLYVSMYVCIYVGM